LSVFAVLAAAVAACLLLTALAAGASAAAGTSTAQLQPSAGAASNPTAPGLSWSGSGPFAAPASASDASVSISPTSATIKSGVTQTYTLTVSCSASGGCNGTKVTFPSTAITGDSFAGGPSTTDFASWVANGSCATAGASLSSGSGVVTFNFGTLANGSQQCTFTVTPPNYTTANNAQVTITPTISGTDSNGSFSNTATTPAVLTVTATENVSFAKGVSLTPGAGATYSYYIDFRCGSTAQGDAGLSTFTVTDPLPAGFTETSVSSGWNGTNGPQPVYNAGTNTVTFSSSTICGTGGGTWTAYDAYRVVITGTASSGGTPDPVNDNVCNTATTSYTYLDGTSSNLTSNQVCVTVKATLPSPFLGKSSITEQFNDVGQYHFAPDGKTYPYTYPGIWDSSNVNSSYYIDLDANGQSAGAEFAVQDPMPCLSNVPSTDVYASNAPATTYDSTTGAYTVSTPGNTCGTPGFVPTYVLASGFTPSASDDVTVVFADGTTQSVAFNSAGNTINGYAGYQGFSGYWQLPATNGSGSPVAELDFPEFPEEQSNTTDQNGNSGLDFHIVGYASSAAQGGYLLRNTATATAYLGASSSPLAGPETATAGILVENPSSPNGTLVRPVISSGLGTQNSTTCTENVVWGAYAADTNSIELPTGQSQPIYIDYLAPAGGSLTSTTQDQTFTLTPSASGGGYDLQQAAPVPGEPATSTTALVPSTTPNYEGTGRTLYEWVIPANTVTRAGQYNLTGGNLTVSLPAGCAGTYQNDVTIGYGAQITSCVYGGYGNTSGAAAPPFITTDLGPLVSSNAQLNTNHGSSTNYCGMSAPLTIAGINPGFTIRKSVQGNLDPAPVAAGGTGNVNPTGGSATYDVTFTNTGATNLVDPVMYDILPAIGDKEASQLTARGSQFNTTLASVPGPLPPGVTVSYSQATNPCRPEVLASDPGCTNDWTTTAPSDLSKVTALKFVYNGTVYVNSSQGITGFTVPYTVNTGNVAAGQIAYNSVGGTGGAGVDGSGNPAYITPAESSITAIKANTSALAITKSTAAKTYTSSGDSIVYTYVVKNSSAVTLTGVGVTDNLVGAPAGDTAPVVSCQSLTSPSGSCSGATTTLASGQSATFTATYRVTQADLDAGQVADTATASGTPPTGASVTATSSQVVVLGTQSPSISLVMSAGPASVDAVGQTVTYAYDVTNTGNVTLSAIGVSSSAFNGSGTLSSISCPQTSLPENGRETCTATYHVTQADLDAGAPLTDYAIATGNPPSGAAVSSAKQSASVPVVQNPSSQALTIQKTATVTPAADQNGVKVGDSIQYHYTVKNVGNIDLKSVAVSDPAQGAVNCPVPVSPGLAPGASETCTAVVTHTVTQADVDAGEVTDTATATGVDTKGNPTPKSPPSTVAVPAVTPAPALSLTKVADASGGDTNPALTVGETIQYSYYVQNTGNVTVSNVHVNDPTGGSVTCPQTTLAPGTSETCTEDSPYVVTQNDLDAGSVTDVATVTGMPPGTHPPGTGPTPIPTSPPSSVTIPGSPTPRVAVQKLGTVTPSADQGSLKSGDKVAYSYVVTNTGNVDLTSVAVSDPTIGTVNCPAPGGSGLAPGKSETCTAASEYSVTVADVGAGTVTDTATATGASTTGGSAPTSAPSIVTLLATPAAPLASIHKVAHMSPHADQRHARIGDKISYTYKVTNVGNVDLLKIDVSDPTIGAVSCPRLPATGLAVHASVTCHSVRRHLVTAGDAKAGVVTDVAVATGTDPRGQVSAVSAQSKAISRVSHTGAVGGRLTLRKVASASTVVGGHDVSYTLTVGNPSKFAVSRISVCDTLPAGMNFVSATPGARMRGEQRCWSIKLLGKHQSKRLQITANVALTHGGRVTNHASASAHGVKTVRASATIMVAPVAISPCGTARAAAARDEKNGHPTATMAC
jgi:uncharacterized repeat protein (TIGR01451 family)